jgi:hypothetical protein
MHQNRSPSVSQALTATILITGENIPVGSFSNSYLKWNLGEPYFIENYLLEKKAPSKNMCNKLGSPGNNC